MKSCRKWVSFFEILIFFYKNNGTKHSQKVKKCWKSKMYCLEYYVLFLKFHVLSCYIYTRYIKKLLLMIIEEAHGMQSDMSFLALLIVFFLQKTQRNCCFVFTAWCKHHSEFGSAFLKALELLICFSSEDSQEKIM